MTFCCIILKTFYISYVFLFLGERPYKCHLPDCGRAFIQLSNLQQHLRNHDAQVERAKNRPFHCNICGKGFATESSLRTHTSKELQLHLGVLQQHAALIGGPNATSCPVCHKLFLGPDALMEHMKHAHKEPCSSSVTSPFPENLGSTCMQSSNDPYLAKRRSANHPCPVCGKHYVNEGSLRKHLACHPETTQLTNSLRMWPCSVCQAVFTHENGLLTHMEHMRMDPKHQFAAQYVLSRAAAERRERDSILAATLAVSASGSGGAVSSGMLPLGGDGGSTSMCPSPSANSECSSNGRLTSSCSDQGSGIHMMHHHQNSNNNNNNCNSNKLNDILRSSSNSHLAATAAQYGVDADLHANRMSLMAASAAAAAAAVAASASGGVTGVGISSPECVDSTTPDGSAAVKAAVVNLAAAMRMNQVNSGAEVTSGVVSGSGVTSNNNVSNLALNNIAAVSNATLLGSNTNLQPQLTTGADNNAVDRESSPTLGTMLKTENNAANAVAAMNAMRSSMLRHSNIGGGVDALSGAHQTLNAHVHPQLSHHAHDHHGVAHHHHQPQQQHSPEALRMKQQAEAILRTHTEAAFRLAATVAASSCNGTATTTVTEGSTKQSYAQQQHADNSSGSNTAQHDAHAQLGGTCSSDPPQLQQQQLNATTQQQQHHNVHMQQQLNLPTVTHQQQHHQQQPDISEALRMQEHRLEQALRLHNDVRTLNFLTAAGGNVAAAVAATQQQAVHAQQQHQQQQQQTTHNP